MKSFPVLIRIICLSSLGWASCSHRQQPYVNAAFADSLLLHYQPPAAWKATGADLVFWRKKIDPAVTGIIGESRYAAALVSRFHQQGDIADIKTADSILQRVSLVYNNKEVSPLLGLCTYSILRHRFAAAEAYLDRARAAGLKKYESLTAAFDVDIELGRYANTGLYIQQLAPYNDYGYYFRRSRWEHLNGAPDSAIQAMLAAAAHAGSSAYLQQVALSNAADLYIHTGELKKAVQLYQQCLLQNAADFHSLAGLGWIALVHDNNDTLAKRLFSFILEKNKRPDPLFRLYQLAQWQHNAALEAFYARAFAAAATDSIYGNMYHKYMVELYTGILRQPARAEALARAELDNRSTPQTNAWYVWTLFCQHKTTQAYALYRQSVSGKPLEGMELYWMGKFLQGIHKAYSARAYFKASADSRYDLSPAMALDLDQALKD